MGVVIPHGSGQFWGVSGPLKKALGVSAAVYAAKEIMQSTIIIGM